MHARAYGGGGGVLAEWRGAAFFYGDLPVRYVAEGAPLRWDNPDAQSIKIDSDAVGASGKTLAQWAPRGTRRVVVDIAARGAGQGAADDNAMTPEGKGAGSEARGSVSRSGWDELFDSMVAGQASEEGVPGGDSGSGSSSGPQQGNGQAQDGLDHGSVTGSERGARRGHARGSESPSWSPGGVPGVKAGGRIGDPEHGKPAGRTGGDPGAEGHIDGPGIVGVLDVSEDIAPLVNAAMVVSDANLAGLGHKLLRQAVEGVAERILRKQIEREARRMARAGLERVARRLDALEKYEHLATAQRKAILDRAEAAMERAHRKRIAQHARSQAEEYERVVAQLEGKPDEQSAYLRKIARENAEGYRQIQRAASRPQDVVADHAGEVPTAKRAPTEVAPAASETERAGALARKLKLNLDSPTTRQILEHLDTPVVEFIAKFRRGNIKARFPGEFLEDHITVEQALTQGGSTVRKLLTDTRFVK